MLETLGVVGGMGPLATVNFLDHFYSQSNVLEERDHARVVTDINPKIPSRTRNILGQGADFVPEVVSSAQQLQGLGATYIAIPCNSAQFKLEEIQSRLQIPVISIVSSVESELPKTGKKVLVLGGPVTFEKDTYKVSIQRAGLEYIKPSMLLQSYVQEVIYAIKKSALTVSQVAALRKGVEEHLEHSRFDTLVLACTELHRGLFKIKTDITVLDSTEAYAKACVLFAQNHRDCKLSDTKKG